MEKGLYFKGKFSAPLTSPVVICRERLHRLLDRSNGNQLHSMIAPAGYGKTTLMREWSQQQNARVVWVTMESYDNDPYRFWSGVLMAFSEQGYHTPTCKDLMSCLSDEIGHDFWISQIMNEIEEVVEHAGNPVVLVIDDLQRLTNKEVIDSLARVLQFLPVSISLYLLSRTRLPSELFALVPCDRVNQVGAEDLAFDLVEAKQYLQALEESAAYGWYSFSSPAGQSSRLISIWRQTEGWPVFFCGMVGRWLKQGPGAGSIDPHADYPEFQEYIEDQILQPLRPEQMDLLASLTPLWRFNRDLVLQCLCPEQSAEYFQELTCFYGIVARVSDTQGDYCIRRPIRDYIKNYRGWQKNRLGLASFTRAFRWFLANNGLYEAITLCVESGYWQSAIHMIEKQYQTLAVSGRWTEISIWFDQIPGHITRQRPLLLLLQAQKSLFECIPAQALGFLDKAEAILATQSSIDHPDHLYSPSGKHRIHEEISELRNGLQSLFFHDHPQWMSNSVKTECHIETPSLLPCYLQGLSAIYGNRLDEAKFLLGSVVEQALVKQQGTFFQSVPALGWIYYLNGDLEQWQALSNSLREKLHGNDGGGDYVAWMNGLMACVSMEYGDVDQATHHLNSVLAHDWLYIPADLKFCMLQIRAQLAISREKYAEAVSVISEAELLAQDIPRIVLQSYFSIIGLKAEVLLAQGKKEEALHQLEVYGGLFDGASLSTQHEMLIRARVYIAMDRTQEAMGCAAQVKEWAVACGADLFLLRSLITEAIALSRSGRDEKALNVFHDALGIGRMMGSVTSFMNAFPEMRKLLAGAQNHGRYPAYVGKLIEHYGGEPDSGSDELASLSSLSKREKQVLDLLVTGMSNPEIADTLCRSLGTVKIHVHNIYRKLGATNRVAAINKYLGATA